MFTEIARNNGHGSAARSHSAFGLMGSGSRSNSWDIVYFIPWVSVLAIIYTAAVRVTEYYCQPLCKMPSPS